MVYWFSYAYTPTDSHTYCVSKPAINVVVNGLFLHFLQYRYATLCKFLKHIKERFSLTVCADSTAQYYSIKLLDYKSHTHRKGAIL